MINSPRLPNRDVSVHPQLEEHAIDYSTDENSSNYINSFRFIFKNLLPNIGTTMLFLGVDMIKVHYIGKTKDIILFDALGLGTLFYNVAYFIGAGLTEGISVECSRSIGNKNFKLFNLQANQARFIMFIFSLFYTLVNLFLARPLLTYGFSGKEFLEPAITYVYYTLPSFLMEMQFEVYIKLTESQLSYNPVLVSMFTGVMICPPLCILFVDYLQMGIIGMAIVTNIIQFTKLSIMIYTYTFIIKGLTYDIFNKNIFTNNFKGFFMSLFLSMLIFASDCGGSSISNSFASVQGEVAYAKFLVVLTIATISYGVNYGFVNTSCLLIGNVIGANSPSLLKKLVRRLLLLGVLLSIPLIIAINIWPRFFINIFSESEELNNDDETVLYVRVLTVGIVFDNFHSNMQGILRGLGILYPTVYAGVFSFFIMLPIFQIVLTNIYNLSVLGVLIADILSYVLYCSIQLVIFFMTDYEEACQKYIDECLENPYRSFGTSNSLHSITRRGRNRLESEADFLLKNNYQELEDSSKQTSFTNNEKVIIMKE